LEIVEGIHNIPGLRGANVYLVIDEETLTVVDTGMPGNESKIIDYIKRIGMDPSQVKNIVLTHSDIDHSGSAAKLKEMTNAKVMIHEADAPRLSEEKELKKVKGFFGVVMKVAGIMIKFTPVKPDVTLKNLDKVGNMTVLHTPGHTEGSICLYITGKAIFAGDLVRVNNNKMLELPPKFVNLDMDMLKVSLKKVSELEYSVLLPGHGPPLTQKASDVVKEFVAREIK
jgi:glyoxylase-like metal-dependent hydrolase (beta-lactamase superfamily II)